MEINSKNYLSVLAWTQIDDSSIDSSLGYFALGIELNFNLGVFFQNIIRIELIAIGKPISELFIIFEHKKLAFGWVSKISFGISGCVEDGVVFGNGLFGLIEFSVLASAA